MCKTLSPIMVACAGPWSFPWCPQNEGNATQNELNNYTHLCCRRQGKPNGTCFPHHATPNLKHRTSLQRTEQNYLSFMMTPSFCREECEHTGIVRISPNPFICAPPTRGVALAAGGVAVRLHARSFEAKNSKSTDNEDMIDVRT